MIDPESKPYAYRRVFLMIVGLLIALSILAYATSFFLPAFKTNDGDGKPVLGRSAFVMGVLGLLMLQTTWLANLALWIGFVLIAGRFWKAATVLGAVATCFALAALLIYEPNAARPPHACTSLSGIEKIRLTKILPGYWYWLGSMVLFFSGCTVHLMSHRGTSIEDASSEPISEIESG